MKWCYCRKQMLSGDIYIRIYVYLNDSACISSSWVQLVNVSIHSKSMNTVILWHSANSLVVWMHDHTCWHSSQNCTVRSKFIFIHIRFVVKKNSILPADLYKDGVNESYGHLFSYILVRKLISLSGASVWQFYWNYSPHSFDLTKYSWINKFIWHNHMQQTTHQ